MSSKRAKSTKTPKASRLASRKATRATEKALRLAIPSTSKRAAGDKAVKATARGSRKSTKQKTCLDLLSRPEGVSIEELQKATGWQQHSVRGFLAGAVKKKLGLTLLSERPDVGPRRYRISSTV